jgi:hypothetical protein
VEIEEKAWIKRKLACSLLNAKHPHKKYGKRFTNLLRRYAVRSQGRLGTGSAVDRVEGVVSVARLVRRDASTGESGVAVSKIILTKRITEILHNGSDARICKNKITGLTAVSSVQVNNSLVGTYFE